MRGQSLNNLRTKDILLVADTIKVDTLSIIPGSLTLYEGNRKINDTLYTIDYINALIIPSKYLKSAYNKINLSYRVFPYDLSHSYFHKDYRKIKFGNDLEKPFLYKQEINFNPFASDNISRSGSISRGISFGNNQDVIVNSNLNLQLSGKISNNLNLAASISDANIPIQPDGYSQQIQEFDKVYISVYNDNLNITGGDFEISNESGYFMRFYKKGQGAIISLKTPVLNQKIYTFNTTLSGATAKGKYARNQIPATEGNQGPYRLTGAENELYIIIIAGTEKIYIDGKLLVRGQENDYIINYNTGELTFTPNQLITKDKRIIAEFEYSDKNYARFMIYNQNTFSTKKGKIWLNIFNEQDSKNQPLQQNITDEQKKLLHQIGNNIDQAVVPNYDSIGYNNESVHYKKVIDPVSGEFIFVYSNNPDSAVYRVNFSYVGEFKGNYIQSQTAANGKVFQYITPVNGTPQGDYEPVTKLITPKKQQLITFGSEINFSKKSSFFIETGISNYDMNTFSTIGDAKNIGMALKSSIIKKFYESDSGKTGLIGSVSYQFIGQTFKPVERIHEVEFERNWNLPEITKSQNEHYIDVLINYFKNNTGNANASFNMLNRDMIYKGFRGGFDADVHYFGYGLKYTGSLLNSKDTLNKTTFFRQYTTIYKKLKGVIFGINNDLEYNQWHNSFTDSLLSNSYYYNQTGVYSQVGDSSKNSAFINYNHRNDKLPAQNILKSNSKSDDLTLGFKCADFHKNIIGIIFTYRKLKLLDTLKSNLKNENSVSSRIEHSTTILKGFISTSTFYELGTGLEPFKEYSYIKVANGQGVYTWIDYNKNNIPELDEFEVANFRDQANYIRVFTPTNRYEKIHFNQFNQIFNLNPYRLWSKSIGYKKFLSEFSNQLAFRVFQKERNINLINAIDPFSTPSADSNLVNLNYMFRNTFSFNKSSTKLNADFIYQHSKDKILLVSGIDTRTNLLKQFQVKWQAVPKLFISDYLVLELTGFESQFFKTRNFLIYDKSNKSEIEYRFNSIQLNMNYTYSEKNNKQGKENSKIHNLGAELKWFVALKGNITVSGNYIFIRSNIAADSPVSYEMLQGLNQGQNVTWKIALTRNFATNLELNIDYEGRLSGKNKPIHLGNFALRANF